MELYHNKYIEGEIKHNPAIDDSGNLLEDMAGTGDWLDGKRLDRGISEDEVKEWIGELGI